jgi:hypothetical protein
MSKNIHMVWFDPKEEQTYILLSDDVLHITPEGAMKPMCLFVPDNCPTAYRVMDYNEFHDRFVENDMDC